MESDDAIYGEKSNYNFGARLYNPKLGRWWSLDNKKKAAHSMYAFAQNSPIMFVDPDGNDDYYFDLETRSVYIVKNGKPNRYFINTAVFPNQDVDGNSLIVGEYRPVQHSIASKEVKSIFTQNVWLYRKALEITPTDSPDYANIYNAFDKVNEGAIIMATVGAPVAIIVVAEVGVGELLWEAAEMVLEEASGIDIIPLKPGIDDLADPIINKEVRDAIEKANKENIGETAERAVKPKNKEINKKFNRGEQPKNSGRIEDIPALGHEGKLDGLIPSRNQWMKYSKADLRQLQSDLIKSIKKRTSDLKTRGADYIHGLRLTKERELLRDITNRLDGK